MRRITSIATWVLLCLACATISRADTMQQLSSRSGLTDTINWSQLGGGPMSNGVSVTSTGGVAATVVGALSGLYVGQQGINWFGSFGFGDYIMDTGSNISGTYGPMTISFASPLSAFATQMEVDAYGPYSGKLAAYNASDVQLALYSFSGNANSNGDNSAATIGVADLSGPGISKIIISDDATTGSAANFAINQVSLSAPLPEPASTTVIGMGGLLLLRRRRMLMPGRSI